MTHPVSTLLLALREPTKTISLRDLVVLAHMDDQACEEPSTVVGLARVVGIDSPGVTRSVDSLSEHGLCERVRSKTSRREVSIWRTPKGQELLDSIVPGMTGQVYDPRAEETAELVADL